MSDFDELPLGTPARRALAGAGVTSFETAAGRTRAEISALHGVGPRAVGVLETALGERGLAFATQAVPEAASPTSVPEAPLPAATTAGSRPEASAPPASAPGASVPPPTNPFAVVALVSAFVMPIFAIIFGHLALRDIRLRGDRGREMAIAGLVLGYLVVGVIVLAIALWFATIVATIVAAVGSVLWLFPAALGAY